MTTLELKLNLPDQLARDAKAAGLLTEPALERLVREALRARSLERLDAATEGSRSAATDERERDSGGNRGVPSYVLIGRVVYDI